MPDGSKNQKADHHPDASSDQRPASTVVFDKVETNESDAKVDTVEDHLRDEGADCDRLEDRSTVVEEIVGASELLEHLQAHPECDPVSDSRSSEHGDNLRDWTALDFALSDNLGLNLFHLYDDGVVVWRSAIDAAKCLFRFLVSALAVCITRRLSEEQDADTKDEEINKADTENGSPGRGAVPETLVYTIVEARGKEYTQCDE